DPLHGGDEPDGVLGVDLLSRYFVVFDVHASRIALYAPETDAPPPALRWNRVSLHALRPPEVSSDLWTISTHFGAQSIHSLLDTGSAISILNWKAAERLVDRRFIPNRNSERVRDALGKAVPAFMLVGLTVNMGGRTWYDRKALVADTQIFHLLEL